MSLTIKLTGVKEAVHALRELPASVQRKHMRIGMNAAGGIIKRDAVSRVPKETGLLKQSLAVKVTNGKRGWYCVVGPKRGLKRAVRSGNNGVRTLTANKVAKLKAAGTSVTNYRNPSRYAHLVEGGTRRHGIVATSKTLANATTVFGRKVNHPGAKASRFLATSAKVAGPQAAEKAVLKIKEGVEAEARKLSGVA